MDSWLSHLAVFLNNKIVTTKKLSVLLTYYITLVYFGAVGIISRNMSCTASADYLTLQPYFQGSSTYTVKDKSLALLHSHLNLTNLNHWKPVNPTGKISRSSCCVPTANRQVHYWWHMHISYPGGGWLHYILQGNKIRVLLFI